MDGVVVEVWCFDPDLHLNSASSMSALVVDVQERLVAVEANSRNNFYCLYKNQSDNHKSMVSLALCSKFD